MKYAAEGKGARGRRRPELVRVPLPVGAGYLLRHAPDEQNASGVPDYRCAG